MSADSQPIRLAGGYFKGCLLPTATMVAGALIVLYFVLQVKLLALHSNKAGTDGRVYCNARMYYMDAQYPKALELIEQILEIDPHHPEANELKGKILDGIERLRAGDKQSDLRWSKP